jgi:uncharacterized protein
MPLTEIAFGTAQPVEGYGPGFLRVAGQVLRGAVMVSPWGAQGWGGWDDTATPLTLAGRIDVLLVGTGADIAHPPAAFRQAIEAAGIGVEPMGTPAALRTYNVLLGEARRIALVALPV